MQSDDRFARFGLIEWWQQSLLTASNVVVVGAGALGNEVIKGLALLGIGRLVIVDLDRIETSISRARSSSALPTPGAPRRKWRPGRRATSTRGCSRPDSTPTWCTASAPGCCAGRIWSIGALDNREARLTVNRLCYSVGTPSIDGAIEALSGVARVFAPPESACYECSMSELDWKLLAQRHSCSLLNPRADRPSARCRPRRRRRR